MRFLQSIILSLLFVTQVRATEPQVAMIGPGTASYSVFAKVYAQQPELIEALYFSWAQGFMSGQNLVRLLSGQPVHNFGAKALKAQQSYLRAYCDRHPLGTYSQAVSELLKTFPLESARAN